MKKTMAFTIFLCGFLLIFTSTGMSTTIYTENFDALGQAALAAVGGDNDLTDVPVGWTVMANNSNVAQLMVTNGVTGGYAEGGYYATGDADDYSLGFYRSAGGNSSVTFTYTATQAVTDISGMFDMEVPWTRYANKPRTGGFANGLTYSVNGGTAASVWAGGTVNDSQSTAVDWFTDAEMDAKSLSIRNIAFSLTGVELGIGDTLTLSWLDSYNSGGSNHKNMLTSIDNFVLEGSTAPSAPVPEPTTMVLFGIGLLGVAGVSRRKDS